MPKLEKWHLLRILIKVCRQPHYKLCICICPKRLWFLFINGDPPAGRRAKELALEVNNFEVNRFPHDSFIDTTSIQELPDDGRVEKALNDEKHLFGFISPSLRNRIIEAVRAHNVLKDDERNAILDE